MIQKLIDELCGCHYSQREVERIQGLQPYHNFKAACAGVPIFAKKQNTFLYQFEKQVVGQYLYLIQEIGDCVSFGAAGAINVLKCVQKILGNTYEEFTASTATEPIYWLSRVLVGNGELRGQDGSRGSWAAQAMKQYGTVVRKKYGNIDLSNYSGQRAKDWGDNGGPQELLPYAHEHLVQTIAKAETIDDIITAITNGHLTTMASCQGFNTVRDKDGFCQPQGEWAHQMYICGYRTDIEGFLVRNSWPVNYVSGPLVYDQPEGSFWVRAEHMDDILHSGSADFWNLSSFLGFPPQEVNLHLF